jgi:hypothetical protein
MALSFKFDHAQNRFARLRIGVALAGKDLASPGSSGIYVVPVDDSIILRPVCTGASWQISSSAPYNKLGISDFGSPSGIKEVDQSGLGAKKFLTGAKNITLQTSTTWAKNTGFVVELLNYSNGANNAIALECGWSSGTSLAADTAFRLYSDGFAEVWRGGVKIATGKISGGGAASNPQNQTIQIIFLPCKKRELLIWSSGGDGFRAIMPDINEDTADPEIVPSAKFWVRQPDLSTNLLVAPLKFATSGYALSEAYVLAEAPVGGSPPFADVLETYDNATWAGGTGQPYRLYGDQSYRTGNSDAGSVVITDNGGSTFVPDGSAKTVRLKVNLSGDGNSTPSIYGAEAGWLGLEAETNNSEEFDATDYVTAFSLSVPEGGGPSARVTVNAHPDVEAGVAALRTQCNRPMEIRLGTVPILNGRASPPQYSRRSRPEAEKIVFEVESTIKALKRYRFRERKPFDGMYVCRPVAEDSLVRWILRQVGVPDSAMVLENSNVRIGDIAPERCGEWAEYADVGASAWEVLSRFLEDYLGGWFYDVVPIGGNLKFVVKSPATIEASAPVIDLYWDNADALAASVPEEDVYKVVVRQMDYQVVEPETNEIVVTGRDPRTGLSIGAIKRDYSSQDPTLAPSARPDNWIGEPAIVGIINAGISTQDTANSAAALAFARLSNRRTLLEIECEFLTVSGVPVWRGDRVSIDGDEWIVTALELEATSDVDDFRWLPCKYTLASSIGGTGGRTAYEIADIERGKRSAAVIQRRNSIGLAAVRRQSAVIA